MTKVDKQAEEIAALRKEVEEIKAKLSPPKPFVSEPYQPTSATTRLRACVCHHRHWRRWSMPSRKASWRGLFATTGGHRLDQPAQSRGALAAVAQPTCPVLAQDGHMKRLSAHLQALPRPTGSWTLRMLVIALS